MGFEPTTSTLARLRSTPELRPHFASPKRRADHSPWPSVFKAAVKGLPAFFSFGHRCPCRRQTDTNRQPRRVRKNGLASQATRALYLLRLKGC